MIRTLTGKNSYAIATQKRELVEDFQKKYGDISVQVIQSDIEDIRLVHAALTTLPFLVERTLVVFERPSEHKVLTEKLPDWLAHKNESTDVLIIEPTIDKRTIWAKYVKSETDYRELGTLSETALFQWLSVEIKNRKLTITPGAIRLLVRYAGFDQIRLTNELDKLQDFGQQIDEGTVAELVSPSLEESIFHLLDELSCGHSQVAYAALDELTRRGTSAHEIVSMLGWQFTNLQMMAVLRGNTRSEIAKKTGLHPFVIEKNQPLAHRLGVTRLRRLIAQIIDAELHIKRDGQKAERVLELLLATLSRDLQMS